MSKETDSNEEQNFKPKRIIYELFPIKEGDKVKLGMKPIERKDDKTRPPDMLDKTL